MPRVIVRPRRGQGGNLFRGMSKLLKGTSITKPGFSDTWAVSRRGSEEDVIERYDVVGSKVTIHSSDISDGGMYHIEPWEYGLDIGRMGALRRTMERLASEPPDMLSLDIAQMRAHIERAATGILASELDISASDPDGRKELHCLSQVVGRYTIGLGVIENLLEDPRIEDIYLDSPVSENRIHISLNGVAGMNSVVRCTTNLIASEHEVEALVTRLRGNSSRPFSEAFPVLR